METLGTTSMRRLTEMDFQQIKDLLRMVMQNGQYAMSISVGSDLINVSIYPFEGDEEDEL